MIHDLSIDGVFRKKREPLMIFSSSSVDPYGPPEYHYEALLEMPMIVRGSAS